MIEVENLQKQLAKIAAAATGQVSNVRTIAGRQLLFLNQNQGIMLLPQLEIPDDEGITQVMDATSPNYGKSYTMVDLDKVDNGDSLMYG